jgi:hypothetical protein
LTLSPLAMASHLPSGLNTEFQPCAFSVRNSFRGESLQIVTTLEPPQTRRLASGLKATLPHCSFGTGKADVIFSVAAFQILTTLSSPTDAICFPSALIAMADAGFGCANVTLLPFAAL